MGIVKVSPREFDVLVNLDKSEKEIMKEADVSFHRYKAICRKLFKKFRVHTRTALLIKALKFGYCKLKHFETYYED